MKTLIFLTIATFLWAQSGLEKGLERASNKYKYDACKMAKAIAKENYDVKDIDAECICEKSDAKEWMCFVNFQYLPKEKSE